MTLKLQKCMCKPQLASVYLIIQNLLTFMTTTLYAFTIKSMEIWEQIEPHVPLAIN